MWLRHTYWPRYLSLIQCQFARLSFCINFLGFFPVTKKKPHCKRFEKYILPQCFIEFIINLLSSVCFGVSSRIFQASSSILENKITIKKKVYNRLKESAPFFLPCLMSAVAGERERERDGLNEMN